MTTLLSQAPRWMLRAAGYLSVAVVVTFLAMYLGTSDYATRCEAAADAGECDLAGLQGVAWAFLALCVCALLVVVTEIVLAVRRRRDA